MLTIKTIFKQVNNKWSCIDCDRNGLPFINSGLIGILLADYLDTLGLVIDDSLVYALFETAETRIKYRKTGGIVIIYTSYVQNV